MMKNKPMMMVALALPFVFFTGCAPVKPVVQVEPPSPKTVPVHTVVLAPDPDGRIGKAEIANAAGKALLEKPFEMTKVSQPSLPPLVPSPAPAEYVKATFDEALSVEPSAADKFILFFESGKLKLDDKSQKTLPEILETIKRRNPVAISVSGHADAAGSVQVNNKISLQRAELVGDLLLKNGVDSKIILVSSHGKGNLLVPTPEGVAEARNRRVEVVVR
jgi:outer membrane protein OmpA-like peptidoglycan-associated protein